MSSRHSQPRRISLISRNHLLLIALLAVFGANTGAEAARLGHASVVSAPGQPLRVLLPLTELTPEEAQNLQVTLADAADWQRAGLTPPAPLSDLSLQTQASTDAGRRTLLLQSSEPFRGDAVDVLLNLRSSAGQRLAQVTVLAQRGAPVVQPATVGTPSREATVPVRQGDTLYGIARRHPVGGATLHQTLVALWRANPDAFSGGNMNRLKARAQLTLPDADTVRAIDANEARRIYLEHIETYARYRAGLGRAAGASKVSAASASSGKVSSAETPAGATLESAQDRLRLSGAADARGDASVSDARALADARERVEVLKSNVDALKQAAQGAAAGGEASAQTALNTAAGGSSDGVAAKPAVGDAAVASGTTDGAAPSADRPGPAVSIPAGAGAAAGAAPGAAQAESASSGKAAEQASQVGKDAGSTRGMPGWLADNLLIIVTVVLALLVLIIAFALRRAGIRRDEDNEESPYITEMPRLSHDALDKRLNTINLDLDQPPSDEPGRKT
ncbi:type IV pilus assembly protein FimV [Bordetella avium]|uniref:type IV pilus assembly protein FimV n=1 Tax=Bordetella avium TaxID=521 RepID=UPI000E0B3BB2|nr:FimV/HubP family polar landmark protein [Bordetella avium]AZY52959.1 hypothetical protein C0J07_10980 [Bordetella avium]RIQ11956.1 hypothetical protein D0432_14910 [Bordetella avium]RIQ37055.1 hypothetical protein D0848_12595 [Bordetella avium]RIQ39407.1 hypothetical protein D0847_14785 [Bordetella avium]RIQ40827.1 hypothetical protein D0846_14935 [Bordetella avium]